MSAVDSRVVEQGRDWLRGQVAAVWLVLSLGTLLAQVFDVGGWLPPVVRYAFTWDMYPHFATESRRRVALGETRSGRVLVLHPAAGQQFREGVQGDLTRVDLDRGGLWFAQVVEQTRQATEGERSADPLVRVWLCEQRWPVRYNLSDADYLRWWGASKPVDDRLFPGQGERTIASPPAGIPRAVWRVLAEESIVEGTPGAE